MTVAVTVPATTPVDLYPVTLQATTAEGTVSLNPPFSLNVVPNPTCILAGPSSFPNVKAGSASTTGAITIASQDGFAGNVALTCTTTSGSCSVASPVTVTSSGPGDTTTAALAINGSDSSSGSYQAVVTGTSGALTGSPLTVLFNVGDYVITGTKALTSIPGGTAVANLAFTSEDSYLGSVLTTCNVIAPTGAPPASCTLNTPVGGIPIGNGIVGSLNASVALPPNAAVGSYTIDIGTQDTSGEPSHIWTTALTVQDFAVGSVTPSTQSIGSGQSASYHLN